MELEDEEVGFGCGDANGDGLSDEDDKFGGSKHFNNR